MSTPHSIFMDKALALLERAADEGLRQINDTAMGDLDGFQFQTNKTTSLIDKLKFQKAKSLRTSVIILASFNAVIGLMTVIGIFTDCFFVAKRADPRFRLRSSLLQIIGPADVFPFILSLGILVQGIIFAVEQSYGLDSQLILGCESKSQATLPTTFIVPFIQLVFGWEIAIRALRGRTFPKLSRWAVPVCLVVVILGLIGLYVYTLFERAPNFCFATLVFYIQQWKTEVFSLFVVVTGSLIISTAVVYTRLLTSNQVGAMERKAASRMVYYMCIGIITNALIVPFFAVLTFGDYKSTKHARFKLSMVAMVAANLTGITNGAVYLFLRSCQLGSIGRKGYYEVDRRQFKKKIRLWAPIYNRQIEEPVGPPAQRAWSPDSFDNISAVDEIIYSPRGIPQQQVTVPAVPAPPAPAVLAEAPDSQVEKLPSPRPGLPASPKRKSHVRKTSYSIFPQQTPVPPTPSVPPSRLVSRVPPYTEWSAQDIDSYYETDYTPLEEIRPAFGASAHDRKSSIGTSATIQIGMRFSNFRDYRPTSSIYEPQQYGRPGSFNEPPTPMRSTGPYTTDPTYRWRDSVASSYYDPMRDLPPVPPIPAGMEEDDNLLTLSPTVYSPEKEKAKAKAEAEKAAKEAAWANQSEKKPTQTTEWI